MRFGKKKQFGLLGGGSYDWNGRGINDIEPVPDANTLGSASQRYFDTQDMRDYRYKRSRWGLTGSADYTVGKGSTFAKFLYPHFHDYGDKWVYTLTDNTAGIVLYNSNGCATSAVV